jgi:uncharacterized integral membrane protein
MYALLAIAALLIIYLVAFVVANSNRVEVSFVVADAHASLIWVMLVCTAIGIVIGIVLSKLWGRTRGVRTSSAPGPGAATTPGGGGTVTGPTVGSGPPGASTPTTRRPGDPPA